MSRSFCTAVVFSTLVAPPGVVARGVAGEGDAPPEREAAKGKRRGKPNRLAREKSPYLLQHAYNPVDWHPWGDEAFEKARAENKPVFLSIGYSTCHWCHVMEHESFEDERIAAYLNEHFVSIKVDREERPDVDAVYMAAVHAMGRSGGWPLSAFLTPDRTPFFAATYFPPNVFHRVLQHFAGLWSSSREKLTRDAGAVARRLQAEIPDLSKQGGLEPSLVDAAFRWYPLAHDPVYGGFGRAPKFPRTSNVDFLLRHGRRTGSREALDIAFRTLDNMLRGGIRDHLAGGFHRYSTDRQWLVPHFEKMLYDNALIPRTLIDAYRVSGDSAYLRVARETLDYVLERLEAPGGGFYSAEDADTEGEEGKTYVWTRREVLDLLGEEKGKVFADYYGVTERGNFEGGPRSVIHITLEGGEKELANRLGRPPADVELELAEGREKLLAARHKRPQPFLDDKVLAAWNGLAISAFSHAWQVTREKRYLDAARRAAGFILDRMLKDQRLYRRYRGGEVKIEAFLEDHAFFIEGLLDLYETDHDRRWLEEAVRLGKGMVSSFWDPKNGGFFSSADHHEKLIVRLKAFHDGAVPSGNSVAFLILLRLHEFTSDKTLDGPISTFQKIAAGLLSASPQSYPQLLCAVEYLLAEPLEIVIVGKPAEPLTRAMIDATHRRFLPAKILVQADDAAECERMGDLVPLVAGKQPIAGKPTAFVCRQRVCKLPARDIETFRKQLER